MTPDRITHYKTYVTSDWRNLDHFEAACEAAAFLDLPETLECTWPLTDWWPADYARLRRTPAPCAVWWR